MSRMTTETSVRTRLLTVADELFYQRGLQAVGVDEIVAQSGVAKTTLYAHFKSKDLLIAAYLQRRSEASRRVLEAEMQESQDDAAEKLDRIFHLIADGCASPSFRGCPFINFAVEFPDRSHPGWPVCLEYRQWVHRLFAEIARSGGAATPERLADRLCLLYDAAMVGSMFDRDGHSAQVTRETADTLVKMKVAFSAQD